MPSQGSISAMGEIGKVERVEEMKVEVLSVWGKGGNALGCGEVEEVILPFQNLGYVGLY